MIALVQIDRLALLTQGILERGFSRQEMAKIMGGNVVRVLGETLPEAGD